MGFYYLSSMEWNGDLISFPDSKGRLFDFFIQDKGDGLFLQYTKPKGIAQENFSVERMKNADYLPAVTGIPIFSVRAKKILEMRIPGKINFYECVIDCKGNDNIFFMGKVNDYLPLISQSESLFRKLSDNRDVIFKPFFDYKEPFFIARDNTYRNYLVVSEEFVKICKEENIRMIDFLSC
ncbi:hypothetical protein RCN32_17060 [Escherichia marmotae]|uniref:Immunity protein 43 domain-containing protein n=1 Tax=Escherichia marmotae TaxID=1499973 RepID=A0A7Z8ZNA0_9ESCH|nr:MULTISPECIES: hypothetical protein [Escherichia]EFO1362400.1 hypothetical protein [Escherichia coli]EGD4401787.1 hypothetical protein [Escherichia coli]EOW69073.1 hypothetical protein A31E_00208 [Escherichia sp. KTE159]MBB2301663.1 hypothetical protein [Escherichia sp. 93.1447]MBB2408388.1 hypothetical protein [Escherichia sp. 14.0982]